jgi:hypothetical protein
MAVKNNHKKGPELELRPARKSAFFVLSDPVGSLEPQRRLPRSLLSLLLFALHHGYGSLDQLAREGQRSEEKAQVELHRV